jgi:signal transduction histidine kinase
MDEPYGNLQYVYIKDMQSLADFKTNIIEVFVTIGVVVSLILSVVMLFMLGGLTAPFRKLNAAAAEISAGNYSRRAAIKSRDEVGDFARSFDIMTDRIETHIAELSRMTESRQNFIDNLAHEIRTPITAIVGYAELLKYADEGFSAPVWWINLYPTDTEAFSETGSYTAILDAATGEALKLLSAAGGKG